MVVKLLPVYNNIDNQEVTISLNERDLNQLSYGVDILFDDRDKKVKWEVVEDGQYDGRRCLGYY